MRKCSFDCGKKRSTGIQDDSKVSGIFLETKFLHENKAKWSFDYGSLDYSLSRIKKIDQMLHS